MSSLSDLYDPEKFRTQGLSLINLLADQLTDTLTSADSKVIDWKTPNEEYEFWKAFESDDSTTFFTQILKRSIQIHRPNLYGTSNRSTSSYFSS